jgi:ubiquinone/menaquinone biosynthesis C-methylase UbiE
MMTRELNITQKIIRHYDTSISDVILDVPCGTGIAGPVLSRLPVKILAADISNEMMVYATSRYAESRFCGFVQSDVTSLPLRDRVLLGAVVLGFMHRVPADVKALTFRELARVCSKFLVVSFSVDSQLFRLKKWLRKLMGRQNRSAPEPIPFSEIVSIAAKEGYKLTRSFSVLPLVSSEVILWMEKE